MNYPTNNAMATTAGQPVHLPEVSTVMERLTSKCEQLDKGLVELEQRLVTVLAQRMEAGGDKAGQPEPVRVPLAQAIYDRGTHLSLLNERLQSIIDRIEV